MLVQEDVVHGQNERVVRLKQNIFLVFRVLNLLFVNQDVFVYPLHRIQLFVLRVDDQEDLSEGALVYHLNDLEVLESVALAFL